MSSRAHLSPGADSTPAAQRASAHGLPATARVVAVSRSAVHGFCKEPQPSIRLVAGDGVESDAHRGATVQHLYKLRRDPSKPNLCQVHLFAHEMLLELAAKGFALGPGEIGENVLTEGLDLLALPRRTRLRLGREATVEVTGLRTPCVRMDRYRAGLQQHLWGERVGSGGRVHRAGVMGVVLCGGVVQAGDHVDVLLPAGPHQALTPV